MEYEIEVNCYLYNQYGDWNGNDQQIISFSDKKEAMKYFNENKDKYDEIILKNVLKRYSIDG